MPTPDYIHLVECPRDAMQGWPHHIPTHDKIRYLNSLLKVGFDTLDCGSFVSPKAIPQMADTRDVLPKLDLSGSITRLLAIVANTRGAQEAISFDEVSALGFPFSISPTFQLRNTNGTMEEGMRRVEEIQDLCIKHHKQLVIYLSMAFGNPYGDSYHEDILLEWAYKIIERGIQIISLADTVGKAGPSQISSAIHALKKANTQAEIGVHLHTTSTNRSQKLEAALKAGCTRFDGAIKGIGGCPMAGSELVGNMDTEFMISYLEQAGTAVRINREALKESVLIAGQIFQ